MNEPYCRCAGCGECSSHRKEPKLKARIEALERERDRNLDSINVGNTIINKQRDRIAELEAEQKHWTRPIESPHMAVLNKRLLEALKRIVDYEHDFCVHPEDLREIARAAIAEAQSTQPEIQTDTLVERKDAALLEALEALEEHGAPFLGHMVDYDDAIAKIKEAL